MGFGVIYLFESNVPRQQAHLFFFLEGTSTIIRLCARGSKRKGN